MLQISSSQISQLLTELYSKGFGYQQVRAVIIDSKGNIWYVRNFLRLYAQLEAKNFTVKDITAVSFGCSILHTMENLLTVSDKGLTREEIMPIVINNHGWGALQVMLELYDFLISKKFVREQILALASHAGAFETLRMILECQELLNGTGVNNLALTEEQIVILGARESGSLNIKNYFAQCSAWAKASSLTICEVSKALWSKGEGSDNAKTINQEEAWSFFDKPTASNSLSKAFRI